MGAPRLLTTLVHPAPPPSRPSPHPGAGPARLLILSLALALLAGPLAAGAVNATGGAISQVNLSVDAVSDRWYLFYGSANGSALASLNLSNLSSSSALDLGPTYSQYLISNVANPFASTNFSAADLNALDSLFDLGGTHSAAVVFNDTATFEILSNSSGLSQANLSLPALLLPGYSGSTLLPDAFRVGAMQSANNTFIFVVPLSSGRLGTDNRSYQYQFALPFSLARDNRFYVFTIPSPAAPNESQAPAAPSGGSGPAYVDFSWTYSDGTLSVHTLPGASVTVVDPLGETLTVVADRQGNAAFPAKPGLRYTIKLSLPGRTVTYGSSDIPLPDQSVSLPPVSSPPGPCQDEVRIERTARATMLCICSDCYEMDSSLDSDLERLVDITCEGDTCRLVGTDREAFVKRNNLRKLLPPVPARPAAAERPLDIGSLLDSLGQRLAGAFGSTDGTWPEQGRNAVVVLAALAVGAFVVYGLYFRPPKYVGGYD